MVSFSSTHGPSRQTATERYTELRAAFLDRSDYDPAENCSAEKGGRLYSEISALIYESNIDENISVKNARKIFCGISVLISAIKHKFSTNGGINPTKFVSNFRVNCRHPKAIAGRGRDKWLDLLVHPTASSCCRPISCLNLNTLCKLRSPS